MKPFCFAARNWANRASMRFIAAEGDKTNSKHQTSNINREQPQHAGCCPAWCLRLEFIWCLCSGFAVQPGQRMLLNHDEAVTEILRTRPSALRHGIPTR